jgi:hypothetical protein
VTSLSDCLLLAPREYCPQWEGHASGINEIEGRQLTWVAWIHNWIMGRTTATRSSNSVVARFDALAAVVREELVFVDMVIVRSISGLVGCLPCSSALVKSISSSTSMTLYQMHE